MREPRPIESWDRRLRVMGAVWLDPEMTNPFDFWQFWRNIEDDRVLPFWRLFTLANEDVIQGIMRMPVNDQKAMLANAVTTLVHGVEQSDRCYLP